MSMFAGFMVGLLIGMMVEAWSQLRNMDRQIKSGHIRDSDHNLYRVEKE